jgi:hypothetical protein
MARIISDYNNYLPVSTTKTLHSGSGKVHAILATSDSSTGMVTIYDNTAASGSILFQISLNSTTPAFIILPAERPLRFHTGLTVVTDANTRCLIISEA